MRRGRQLFKSLALAPLLAFLLLSGCTYLNQLASQSGYLAPSDPLTITFLNQWGRWQSLTNDWFELDGEQAKGSLRIASTRSLASLSADIDGAPLRVSRDRVISFRNTHDGQHHVTIRARTAGSDGKLVTTERVVTVNMRR